MVVKELSSDKRTNAGLLDAAIPHAFAAICNAGRRTSR